MSCRVFSAISRPAKCFHHINRHLSSYALKYKEYGDPAQVLEKTETPLDDTNLEPQQVVVQMLAAPVNPADINMIQGKYAIKPKLPAIGGNEGVGEVVKVGSSVSKLQIGTRVIPASAGWGTWRTHAIGHEDQFIEIDRNLPLVSAATITVNPCTAYRMLKDFVNLKPGDTVIQNGANSGVGQAVIQIAKHLKVNTINVVRDRPNLEALKDQLTALGATYIVTEGDLRTMLMEDIFSHIPKPSLGLNCVGGKSAAELIRHMKNKGTMVTYGGMSKQPLTISTASFIFNDIRMRGYWMTQWSKDSSMAERNTMFSEITSLFHKQVLKPPANRQVPFDSYKDAIIKSMEPFVSEKQILIMTA